MENYLNDELKQKINAILKNDGVICFVTDTVWGLGCLPNSKKAVEKIYKIKNREAQKPLILMSDKVESLLEYVTAPSDKALTLIQSHFPGALTLVMKKSTKTPDFMTSNMDTVGIRVPDNKVFQEICASIEGSVLATTSANLSHEPSALTFEQANAYIGAQVDLILEDFAQSANGLESTVALILGDEVKILRQGAIKILKD